MDGIDDVLDTIDKGASIYGKIKASRKKNKGVPHTQYQPSEGAPIAAATAPQGGMSLTGLVIIAGVAFLLLRK